MTAIFVSDLHIDDPHPQILEGFRAMLDREADAADALYILGDLVEVWVGDDDDSALADAVRETLRDAAARCPVYLMHGNRDFMIGERFADETGVTLIDDPHLVVVEGRRLVLAHGDAFCTADTEYQRMRTLFRSRKWQAEMLGRPLSERRTLARGMLFPVDQIAFGPYPHGFTSGTTTIAGHEPGHMTMMSYGEQIGDPIGQRVGANVAP